MQARQDDPVLVEMFGGGYTRYMESVPRMNVLAGLLRLLRRGESGAGGRGLRPGGNRPG